MFRRPCRAPRQTAGAQGRGGGVLQEAVRLELLEAESLRAAFCHHHLQSLAAGVEKSLRSRSTLSLLLIPLPLSLALILVQVDLAQQVVDEDGAAQVGFRIVQETQFLQRETQDAAALLPQDQVLPGQGGK